MTHTNSSPNCHAVKSKFAAAALFVFLGAGIIGCGGGSPNAEVVDSPLNQPPVVTERGELCVSNACGSAEFLVRIPNAENMLFTPDGRLFVTGDRVYEIDRDMSTNAIIATPIDDGQCDSSTGFLGLAQRGNVLYAICSDGPQLYAGEITQAPVLSGIHTISNTTLPNGMTSDNDGRLYITDGPTSMTPQILRMTIDPNDPFVVQQQEVWLTDSLEFPNGIDFDGSDFYVADARLFPPVAGVVTRVGLNADGSPGTPEVIYEHTGVLDDLSSVDADNLLVTDFANGYVFLLTKGGELLAQTNIQTTVSASSVRAAETPLFDPTDVLITDKGVLVDANSNTGNALILFRRN